LWIERTTTVFWLFVVLGGVVDGSGSKCRVANLFSSVLVFSLGGILGWPIGNVAKSQSTTVRFVSQTALVSIFGVQLRSSSQPGKLFTCIQLCLVESLPGPTIQVLGE
jgi:hypothetical protein